jgi:protein-tyrosine phosphatase
MYEILDDLYLASYNDLKYSGQFDSSTFAVVNCTKNLKMLGHGTRIAVDDDRTRESNLILYNSLPFVCQWIKQRLDNGQPVVVHCHAGQQRSAAVMAAYLMWNKGLGLEQSVSYIKLCKPDAFLYSVNFQEALEKWSK